MVVEKKLDGNYTRILHGVFDKNIAASLLKEGRKLFTAVFTTHFLIVLERQYENICFIVERLD